ncbi:MAG: hypothetical protein QOH11_1529 [Solirubrobacteraceae bacterium]|nr:hypothetical protein [Solirubrobacteraceae bacterium]
MVVAIVAASVLLGAAAGAGRGPPRPAVRVAVNPVARDTVLATGTVPVTLRAPRDGRVTVRLRLVDGAGRILAASRGFSVRLRRGRVRTLSLPPGQSIVRALEQCGGRRMRVDITPRRRTGLRSSRAALPLALVPPVCGRFFADDSFWNRVVPPDAPLDPASPKLTGELLRQVRADIAGGTGPWINTTRFSTRIYTVPAGQARVRVALPPRADPALAEAMRDVPLPSGAAPSPDSDAALVVWQPSRDTLWELWRLRRLSDGQWQADWGGRIDHVSASPGSYVPPHPAWGASASSLSIAGGLISEYELRRGHIDHALAIGLPTVRADAFALPAMRTDGTVAGADRVPEGAHFRLDPTLDLNSLGLPPVTRILAEAAQRYGLVVRDRAGAVVLYAQLPTPPEPNPYPALFGGSPSGVLRTFPWDRLRLLRMDLRPVPGRSVSSGCGTLLIC